YKGRLGVYQVMPMSEAIQAIVLKGGNALDIANVAKDSGVRDLRQSALLKVKHGLTSLAEINRITVDCPGRAGTRRPVTNGNFTPPRDGLGCRSAIRAGSGSTGEFKHVRDT